MGDEILDTSRRDAESAPLKVAVGAFKSGWPPKESIRVESMADKVCHARAGPHGAEELMSSHGGAEAENGEERDKNKRSSLLGADVYENELNWSVLPPCTNRASLITAVA